MKEGGKNHRLFFLRCAVASFFFSLVLLTLQIVFKKCCPLFVCLPSVWIGALRHSCEQLSCRSAAKRFLFFPFRSFLFFFLILTARSWTKMCRPAPSLRFFHLYLVSPIMWGARFFFFGLDFGLCPRINQAKKRKRWIGEGGSCKCSTTMQYIRKKKKGSRTRCAVLFPFFMFVLSDEVHFKKKRTSLSVVSKRGRKKKSRIN